MISEKNPLLLIYLFILLCNTLVYIYKLIKIKQLKREDIGIATYIFLTFCTEFTGSFIVTSYNSWVFNIFLILSIPVIIFYLQSITSKFSKKLHLSAGIIYLIFALTNIVFFQGFRNFNYNSLIIGDILITPLLFLFLYQQMQQLEQPIHHNPHFYNVVGFLILFVGNFAFFTVRLNFQEFAREYIENILMIIRINNVLTYSIFLIGALCLKTNRK